MQWGTLSGEEFSHAVRSADVEIAHWGRKVFSVPSGKAGKRFVRAITTLLSSYAQATAMESVAMDAVMVASTLLLQKKNTNSDSKEHAKGLERRPIAWCAGDINGLMTGGRTIQGQLNQFVSMKSAKEKENMSPILSQNRSC